jgi:hypothetical protein
MLPFEPEPVIVLKQRYRDAIRDIINPRVVARDPALAPSKKREHVFDFPDGLRLIISTDQIDGVRTTHYSASMNPTNSYTAVTEYVKFVIGHINEIRPDVMQGQVVSQITQPAGILHLFYNEMQPKGQKIPVQKGNPNWN